MYIVMDSGQDPDNGGMNNGLFGYNNLPDEESNNHGQDGVSVEFMDGHAAFIPKEDWIKTVVYDAHMAGSTLTVLNRITSPVCGVGLGNRYWIE